MTNRRFLTSFLDSQNFNQRTSHTELDFNVGLRNQQSKHEINQRQVIHSIGKLSNSTLVNRTWSIRPKPLSNSRRGTQMPFGLQHSLPTPVFSSDLIRRGRQLHFHISQCLITAWSVVLWSDQRLEYPQGVGRLCEFYCGVNLSGENGKRGWDGQLKCVLTE